MPYTVNLSGTTQVDNSIVDAFDQQFIIENEQMNMFSEASGLVQYKREIGAKSITLTRYGVLTPVSAALTETDDATSEAMADTAIVLTPKEYGRVITTTNLASLQSGGKVDMAAASLVGQNLGRSHNILALRALEASTNAYNIAGKAQASILKTDVMTAAHLNIMYNKLSRASVPTIGGSYVAMMHDDVIHDLRVSSGEWIDVTKYATPETALSNEVGMLRGFRIIRNNDATITAVGSPAVQVYKTVFMGFNGLGYAESQTPELRITGPFDKLGRFVNVGWYGVFEYKIIESAAVWVSESGSSLG